MPPLSSSTASSLLRILQHVVRLLCLSLPISPIPGGEAKFLFLRSGACNLARPACLLNVRKGGYKVGHWWHLAIKWPFYFLDTCSRRESRIVIQVRWLFIRLGVLYRRLLIFLVMCGACQQNSTFFGGRMSKYLVAIPNPFVLRQDLLHLLPHRSSFSLLLKTCIDGDSQLPSITSG